MILGLSQEVLVSLVRTNQLKAIPAVYLQIKLSRIAMPFHRLLDNPAAYLLRKLILQAHLILHPNQQACLDNLQLQVLSLSVNHLDKKVPLVNNHQIHLDNQLVKKVPLHHSQYLSGKQQARNNKSPNLILLTLMVSKSHRSLPNLLNNNHFRQIHHLRFNLNLLLSKKAKLPNQRL
jgi:hypothetical protein